MKRPDIEKLLKESQSASRLGGMTTFDSQEVHAVCKYALELGLEKSMERVEHLLKLGRSDRCLWAHELARRIVNVVRSPGSNEEKIVDVALALRDALGLDSSESS